MYCTKCGTQHEANFCPKCGTAANIVYAQPATASVGTSSMLECPRCHSHNINVQAVTEVKEKRKKGLAYWLLIGWWWEIIAWLLLTLPKLLFALFSKKTKTVSKTHTEAVCQNCGNRWRVK